MRVSVLVVCKNIFVLFRSSRQKCTVTHAVYFASLLWKVRSGGGERVLTKPGGAQQCASFYLLYPNPASTTRPLQLATQPPTKRTNTRPNTKSRGHPAPQPTEHTHIYTHDHHCHFPDGRDPGARTPMRVAVCVVWGNGKAISRYKYLKVIV